MPKSKRTIDIARVYDLPQPDSRFRVLVDRLWPRGRSRDELRLDEWAREIAPSTRSGSGSGTTRRAGTSSAPGTSRSCAPTLDPRCCSASHRGRMQGRSLSSMRPETPSTTRRASSPTYSPGGNQEVADR